MRQFENFRASSLYCRKCGRAMPVRERLLLVLPGKEIFDLRNGAFSISFQATKSSL